MARFTSILIFLAVMGPPSAVAQEPPQRIVSIGGAVTEILYALGQEDRIVGVDTTSLFPVRALQEKPDVGYMRQLSAEGVLALSPDLIVMDEGAGPPEAVALIDAAGVRVEHVPAGHTVDDLAEKMRLVSAAVGKVEDGATMAEALRSQFDALAADLSGIEDKRRILFVLSLVDGRPNAAGRGTGADAIIALAGGVNVMADATGYKALSLEAAAALEPDVILVVSRAGESAVADPLAVPALAATPAGQAGAVIRMDADYLLGFGPRTPAAARELAGLLYPDRDLGEAPRVR